MFNIHQLLIALICDEIDSLICIFYFRFYNLICGFNPKAVYIKGITNFVNLRSVYLDCRDNRKCKI